MAALSAAEALELVRSSLDKAVRVELSDERILVGACTVTPARCTPCGGEPTRPRADPFAPDSLVHPAPSLSRRHFPLPRQAEEHPHARYEGVSPRERAVRAAHWPRPRPVPACQVMPVLAWSRIESRPALRRLVIRAPCHQRLITPTRFDSVYTRGPRDQDQTRSEASDEHEATYLFALGSNTAHCTGPSCPFKLFTRADDLSVPGRDAAVSTLRILTVPSSLATARMAPARLTSGGAERADRRAGASEGHAAPAGSWCRRGHGRLRLAPCTRGTVGASPSVALRRGALTAAVECAVVGRVRADIDLAELSHLRGGRAGGAGGARRGSVHGAEARCQGAVRRPPRGASSVAARAPVERGGARRSPCARPTA